MTDKAKFMELFEVPEFIKPFLDYFITDKDIKLVNILGNKKMTVEEAASKLNQEKSVTRELLEEAYLRYLLNKETENNKVYYFISNFYSKLGVYDCLFNDNFFKLPEKIRKKLEAWEFKLYTEEMLPNLSYYAKGEDTDIGKSREAFVILDELDELLDKANRFKVIPCNCRILKEGCERPLEVCLRFDTKIEDRTPGRELTRGQARELILEADKQGLMHTVNADWRNVGPQAMCNCCRCCCYPLRLAEIENTQEYWPVSNYIARVDKQKCKKCGTCVNRCHYEAFYYRGNEDIVFVPENCWGCGLCKNSCPNGAIQMVEI